jgi:hypothetical protein
MTRRKTLYEFENKTLFELHLKQDQITRLEETLRRSGATPEKIKAELAAMRAVLGLPRVD